MKKFLVLAAILTLVFAGCPEEETPETQLTIKNESGKFLEYITWNNTEIKDGRYFSELEMGKSLTETVQSGSGYIFFGIFSNYGYRYRTNEIITVNDGKKEQFIFTNNTLIVNVNGSESIKLGDAF